MIKRLYVHNYRCLENFALNLDGLNSLLLIGRNGSGKSTLLQALQVLQQLSWGPGRISDSVGECDYSQHRTSMPMRFEIEVEIAGSSYDYQLALKWRNDLGQSHVFEESLSVDGENLFHREKEQVHAIRNVHFTQHGHYLTLPMILDESAEVLKRFLGSMLLLAPIPANMSGYSEEESSYLQKDARNFASLWTGLLAQYPAAYGDLEKYLALVLPELSQIQNVPRGEKGKRLLVEFRGEHSEQPLRVAFDQLSDGEKCFFLSALVVVVNKFMGPVFCFWDEPDNHLSLPEVGHLILELRKTVGRTGQFLATSHHPETIRKFSDENTLVISRNSHLEPSVVQFLKDRPYTGDLIEALIRDEILA